MEISPKSLDWNAHVAVFVIGFGLPAFFWLIYPVNRPLFWSDTFNLLILAIVLLWVASLAVALMRPVIRRLWLVLPALAMVSLALFPPDMVTGKQCLTATGQPEPNGLCPLTW